MVSPHSAPQPVRRAAYLAAKARLDALYSPECLLCELRCRVDRAGGVRGECGLAEVTPVYKTLVHLGEERELVPSMAVWLAGCNFQCTFCSDEHALRPPFPGKVLSAEDLAVRILDDIEACRWTVKNVNFVGGEPSISLPYLADVAIALCDSGRPFPPLLLNTNGFMTRGAMEAAIDLFDIFVFDYKFGSDACSTEKGALPNYSSVVGRNLARALAAGREVWIRHLLMPGHIDCCTRAVIGAVGKLQGEARFNLMPAFVAFNEGEGKLSNAEIFSAREALASEDIRHKYWDGKAFG